MRLCCYKSPTAVFSVAVQLLYAILSLSLESKMRNLIFVKYDITPSVLLFAQSLQSICNVYVDTPTAGDRFLYDTTWYTKVNMVIIELYKTRVTHMNYIEGKRGFF